MSETVQQIRALEEEYDQRYKALLDSYRYLGEFQLPNPHRSRDLCAAAFVGCFALCLLGTGIFACYSNAWGLNFLLGPLLLITVLRTIGLCFCPGRFITYRFKGFEECPIKSLDELAYWLESAAQTRLAETTKRVGADVWLTVLNNETAHPADVPTEV